MEVAMRLRWMALMLVPVALISCAQPSRSSAGEMARMLALKREHPLPAVVPLPETFDFSLDRNQQCPAERQFDDFASKYPLWGMPYGLPGLAEAEHDTVMRWIEEGAPYQEPDSPPPAYKARIQEWEAFLNDDAPKHRLMSRYLYEHLFFA